MNYQMKSVSAEATEQRILVSSLQPFGPLSVFFTHPRICQLPSTGAFTPSRCRSQLLFLTSTSSALLRTLSATTASLSTARAGRYWSDVVLIDYGCDRDFCKMHHFTSWSAFFPEISDNSSSEPPPLGLADVPTHLLLTRMQNSSHDVVSWSHCSEQIIIQLICRMNSWHQFFPMCPTGSPS